MSLSFSLFLRGIQTTTEFTNASPSPSILFRLCSFQRIVPPDYRRTTTIETRTYSDAEDTRKGEPDGDSKRWRLDG